MGSSYGYAASGTASLPFPFLPVSAAPLRLRSLRLRLVVFGAVYLEYPWAFGVGVVQEMSWEDLVFRVGTIVLTVNDMLFINRKESLD